MIKQSVAAIVGASAFQLLSASVFAQGSLTPPGPPAATMLTLDQLAAKVDQVEKRTPITSLPFIINTPGSYYLTRSFLYTGTSDGITITAPDVVVDLNGFSITCTATSGSGAGVRYNGSTANPLRNVIVRNGTIDNFYYGFYFFGTQNSAIVNVHCANQRGIGAIVQNSSGNLLSRVLISNSAFTGLDFTATSGVTDDNNEVADCIITGAQSRGIQFLATGSGNRLERCIASSNVDAGLYWTGGGSANVVRECSFVGNGADGIYLANAALTGNRIDSNEASKNGGVGIHTVGTSKNLIVRNLMVSNTGGNYTFAAGDAVGQPITAAGIFVSDQPWANFSY